MLGANRFSPNFMSLVIFSCLVALANTGTLLNSSEDRGILALFFLIRTSLVLPPPPSFKQCIGFRKETYT